MESKEKKSKKAKPQSVTVYIPKEGNGAFVEGCHNGTNFRIKTGQTVELPYYIAEILQGARQARSIGEEAAAAYCAVGGKALGMQV